MITAAVLWIVGLIAAAASAGRLLFSGVIATTATRRLNSHQQLQLNEDDEPPMGEIPQDQSLIANQFMSDPYKGRDKLEMIKFGEAKLTQIRFLPDSFSDEGDGSDDYTGIYGIFCVFNDKLNKQEPAVYPTIDHMMHTSDHCREHRYTLRLDEVVEAVTAHDNNAIRSNEERIMKKLPLSGMLFHQGFSGAGLIANALTTFENTAVVSEHSAIRDALNACSYIHNRFNSDNCSAVKQQKLVDDVISLLSRTSDDTIDHMYLKLDSASSAYIHLLRSIYPDAKWTFNYRKAEHVLAKSTEPKRNICVTTRRQPSSVLAAQAIESDLDLEDLSSHELCALHLSTLVGVASHEHESTGTGMLISYDNDLLQENALIELILPYLGVKKEIDANPTLAKERVDEILSMKSSVRGIRSQNIDDKKPP